MKSFVEFFAGVGLVREGLSSLGWECLLANDISSDKRDVYEENYGSEEFLLENVWELTKNINRVPDAFLYTASFPCTDLTVAGAQAGLAGSASGTLNAVLDILQQKVDTGKEPSVVLLENVRGFLSSHKGQDIINTVGIFNSLGYVVDLLELDAIDFSAQSRPRVFLIAVKKSLASQCMTVLSVNEGLNETSLKPSKIRPGRVINIIKKNSNLLWGSFNIEPPVSSSKRLKDIVEEITEHHSVQWWSEERKEKLYEQMNEKHRSYLASMCKSSTPAYATAFRRMRNGFPMVELRVDGFAGCLRTPRGGSSKQILIKGHDRTWSVRFLTPRECARLQGVRDSYILPDNDNKSYFAMGDAVSVPVIEYIASEILEAIYNVGRK
ncbi:DNA cytosine methyltransferase [Vibrio vulnificus]|nr:DNA cytosine methyltransferase [Vibrio vulnificus]ELS9098938.1 DNA cytosine methyltransferase [Vibrio vulnificus]